MLWGVLTVGAVLLLVVVIGAARQSQPSPAGASDAAHRAAQAYFDGYGNDAQIGIPSKRAMCEAIYVGFRPGDGIDPEVYWQGIGTLSGNDDITPQIAREALADRCSPFVDTSYQGPDLVPPGQATTPSGSSEEAGYLDINKLEITVATEMRTQLNLSAEPTVTCPDPVPIGQGLVFTCTAELYGDTADVRVTQTDDQGNVTWKTLQPS